MEIAAEHRREIEKIISAMECPKDFKCYTSGFTELSEVRDVGLEMFVECLAENPRLCQFALPFGSKHFCKCPLRVYISKEFKK